MLMIILKTASSSRAVLRGIRSCHTLANFRRVDGFVRRRGGDRFSIQIRQCVKATPSTDRSSVSLPLKRDIHRECLLSGGSTRDKSFSFTARRRRQSTALDVSSFPSAFESSSLSSRQPPDSKLEGIIKCTRAAQFNFIFDFLSRVSECPQQTAIGRFVREERISNAIIAIIPLLFPSRLPSLPLYFPLAGRT